MRPLIPNANYPIQPCHLAARTQYDLMGAFGRSEREAVAVVLVRFFRETGEWRSFTREEIEAFHGKMLGRKRPVALALHELFDNFVVVQGRHDADHPKVQFAVTHAFVARCFTSSPCRSALVRKAAVDACCAIRPGEGAQPMCGEPAGHFPATPHRGTGSLSGETWTGEEEVVDVDAEGCERCARAGELCMRCLGQDLRDVEARLAKVNLPLVPTMRVLLPGTAGGGTVVRNPRMLAVFRDDGCLVDLAGVPDLSDRATYLLCLDEAERRGVWRQETLAGMRGADWWAPKMRARAIGNLVDYLTGEG